MKKLVITIILTLLVLVLLNNKRSSENFANSASLNKILWDNKATPILDVIKSLKLEWAKCGVPEFNLEARDFEVINSRKRLVDLLPVTNMISRMSYDNVRCFVSNFDSENYLVVSKVVKKVPTVMRPSNIIIVNNMLYKSTPYGVLKYEIHNYKNIKGLSSLNAAIESGILNDYNIYNRTNMPIFALEGILIQKQKDNFVDLKNGDVYKFTDINNKVELMNTKLINKINKEQLQNKNTTLVQQRQKSKKIKKLKETMIDVGGIIQLNVKRYSLLKKIDERSQQPELPIKKGELNIIELIENLVTVIEFGGVLYLIQNNSIKPASRWATIVNDLIAKNNFQIRGVIPHYYYVNNVFNYRLLIIFSDDYYVYVDNNVVSKIRDTKKDLGISFNINVPDTINCNGITVLLDQMKSSNMLSNDKINEVMRFYKC